MASLVRKQDLPPPGGYQPIPYKRVFPKTYFSGYTCFAGFLGLTTASLYLYYLTYKQIKKQDIEMRSAKMAIYPMLLAERDREFLKQLRRNRCAEEKLMKHIKEWEVGTWYGEKVYKLLPINTYVEPIFHEYYAHADPRDWLYRVNIKLCS